MTLSYSHFPSFLPSKSFPLSLYPDHRAMSPRTKFSMTHAFSPGTLRLLCRLPCKCVEPHDACTIDDEYSAAFCMLTRGRCLAAFNAFAAVFDAFADGGCGAVESNSNCCTCRMSTYSSSPAELFGTLSLDAARLCFACCFVAAKREG